MGSKEGPPSEVAAGYGASLADGSDWQHQNGVGISIIKVRMNDQSYVPRVMIVPCKKMC